MLTDPPYLVNYQGRWDGERKTIVGDDDPGWLVPAYAELFRVMKPDSFAVTFYGWPHADLFVGVFKEVGFRLGEPPRVREERLGPRPVHPRPARDGLPAREGQAADSGAGYQRRHRVDREPDAFHPNQKPVARFHPLLRYATRRPAAPCSTRSWGAAAPARAAKDFGLDAIGIEIEDALVPLRRLAPIAGIAVSRGHTLTAGLFTLQALSRVLGRHPWK